MLLVRKWGMQIYGLCKFSESFLMNSKLICDSYSTVYLVYSKITTGLAQCTCHGSGKVKDLEGSLSYRTEVLNFFSSLPSPIAFPTCLSVVLPAALYYNRYSQIISVGPRDLGSIAMDTQAAKKFGPVFSTLALKREKPTAKMYILRQVAYF